MSDFSDLYQELILDHNKRPRNFRVVEDADRQADGDNPLCGDVVTVYLKLDDDRVVDAAFQGAGCAISQASASLMTESLRGKTVAEARQLFSRFRDLLTLDTPDTDLASLGKLAVFAGVKEYPMRVKCATLAWHTLSAALGAEGESDAPVSTE